MANILWSDENGTNQWTDMLRIQTSNMGTLKGSKVKKSNKIVCM